jgi:hypothetical protein
MKNSIDLGKGLTRDEMKKLKGGIITCMPGLVPCQNFSGCCCPDNNPNCRP